MRCDDVGTTEHLSSAKWCRVLPYRDGQACSEQPLRVTAGTLGATAIQQLAGEAEAACVAGEVDRATGVATRLAGLLQGLRRSAAAALAEDPAETVEELPLFGAEIESQVMVDLIVLLRLQNLSAMDRFSSISRQLQCHLGKESYELVRDHVDNLRFSDAANALEETQVKKSAA
jgi:hypothetical protein